MNNNKNRLLVQCFMKMLQQRIERDQVETLSPVFGNILSKKRRTSTHFEVALLE